MSDHEESALGAERVIGGYLAAQIVSHMLRVGAASMRFTVSGPNGREYAVVVAESGSPVETSLTITLEEMSLLEAAMKARGRKVRIMEDGAEFPVASRLVERGFLEEVKSSSKVLPGMRSFALTVDGTATAEQLRVLREGQGGAAA